MRSTHWLTPEGRALRLFSAGEIYLVSDGFGRELLHRGIAVQPTFGDIMTKYPPRLLTLVTPPPYEPITLAEAKLFLRVDGSEEDSLISHLITAAREKAESWLRKSLLTQTWQLQQQYVAGQNVKLPLGPIQEVVSVQCSYLGAATTLTAGQYQFIPEAAEISVDVGMNADRITVQYVAGYDEASHMPAAIKQAILHAVAHYYHHRENAEDFPAEAKRMLADYREVRL
jgi:uncharacterized phiE125 gp8 family phage protein